MNPLKWTSIDLVVDPSPGLLASGINSELSLPLLTSIGCTLQVKLILQTVAVNSRRFLLRCCDASLASGIRTNSSLLPLTSIGLTYQDSSLLQSVLPYLYDISCVDYVS